MPSPRLAGGPLGSALGGIARRPRALLAAAAAALLALFFLAAVPSHRWPGLLPARGAARSIPSSSARVPADLHDILAALDANLTRLYTEHAWGKPPAPLYDGPWLTAAQVERYDHLAEPRFLTVHRARTKHKVHTPAPRYMFTTITRNIAAQLPDLLRAIAVTTYFVGGQHVSFSILEGPSDDPTPHVLEEVLRPLLAHLGVSPRSINLVTNADKIDFNTVNRIEALAELRNRALSPLWDDVDDAYLTRTPEPQRRTVGTDAAAVVFFNDVFLHARDFLELLHQHFEADGGRAGVGITTAWDWMEREPAYFYDVWVARTIDTGDLFYPIEQAWWAPSDNILSSSPASRSSFDHLRPFQVFSSWNGMAVLNPTPFLPPYHQRFRRSRQNRGECAASECSLIAADFWKYNFGRVQVIPSVQLAYDRRVAVQTAQELQRTQEKLRWRDGVPPVQLDTHPRWVPYPPRKVRCHPWPEKTGLDANVWETTDWAPAWTV